MRCRKHGNLTSGTSARLSMTRIPSDQFYYRALGAQLAALPEYLDVYIRAPRPLSINIAQPMLALLDGQFGVLNQFRCGVISAFHTNAL